MWIPREVRHSSSSFKHGLRVLNGFLPQSMVWRREKELGSGRPDACQPVEHSTATSAVLSHVARDDAWRRHTLLLCRLPPPKPSPQSNCQKSIRSTQGEGTLKVPDQTAQVSRPRKV